MLACDSPRKGFDNGAYVVIGVDVSVDRARRGVAKRQKEDVDVEHPVEVGEHLRPMLKIKMTRGMRHRGLIHEITLIL